MTVNELLQKLVELAREGKGQYTVLAYGVFIDEIKVTDAFKEANLTTNEPT